MYLFHGYLHVFLHILCEHLLTMLMQTIWWLESFIIWTSKTWLYEVIWERQNLQRGSGIDLTGVNTPLLGRASLGICCPTSTPNLQAGVRVLCTACVDGLYYPDSVLCLWGQDGSFLRSDIDRWAGQVLVLFLWHIKHRCAGPHVPRGVVMVTLSCSSRWMTNSLWWLRAVIFHPVSICQMVRFIHAYI